MKVLALVIAVLASLVYLKSLKNFFKSKRRTEVEFVTAFQTLKVQAGAFAPYIITIVLLFMGFIHVLFFMITATVAGNMTLVWLATVIIIYGMFQTGRILTYVFDDSKPLFTLPFSKLITLTGIAYLVIFFITI